MAAESFSTVLPTADLPAAVAYWTEVLGAEPTFVDGDRWAQFDAGGRRLSLAGSDRTSDKPAVMVKVTDLDEARAIAQRHGATVGEVQQGPHERRFEAVGPDGWPTVFYTPA